MGFMPGVSSPISMAVVLVAPPTWTAVVVVVASGRLSMAVCLGFV